VCEILNKFDLLFVDISLIFLALKFSTKHCRFIFWLLIIGLLLVSSIPNGTLNRTIRTDQFDFRLDYLLHFIAYFVIGISAALAYNPNWKVLLLLILFAMAEEGHQYWIPNRTVNPMDFMYDMIGLFSGVGLIYLRKRFIP
jgi:VanZ family protein